MRVEDIDLHTYTVTGGTWSELLADLRKQVHARATAYGLQRAAGELGVHYVTLWRMGRLSKCHDSANAATECHKKTE